MSFCIAIIIHEHVFSGWQTVYRGSDLECVCENLRPGTQYKVRVACTSSGGVSDFSDICHICTEPVSPGQCAPPRPHGKPKATSLHLKWGKLSIKQLKPRSLRDVRLFHFSY